MAAAFCRQPNLMTDELARVAALHSAARRYLIERYERWWDHYAAIGGGGGGHYSTEALDTFPRYNVAAAILEVIEREPPDGLGTLAAARERLASLGLAAESPFTRAPQGPIETNAIAEERDAFAKYMRTVAERKCLRSIRCPFDVCFATKK